MWRNAVDDVAQRSDDVVQHDGRCGAAWRMMQRNAEDNVAQRDGRCGAAR